MPRWSEQEVEMLTKVRERLGAKLTDRPQFPEVVGDRKLMRFIRGHNFNEDKICTMIEKFLAWRLAEDVDTIRADIVDNKLDNPKKFPCGEKILKINPMMIFNPKCRDQEGSYISAEGCIPKDLWDEAKGGVTPDEYVRFRIYCLEFLALVLERQGDIAEAEAIKDGEPEEPYGVMPKLFVIRNLQGLGLMDFAGTNKEVSTRMMKNATDNYPELLKRYYVVNAPWVFTTIFTALKLFLEQKTIDKIKVIGGGFMDTIVEKEGVSVDMIPAFIGGEMKDEDIHVDSPEQLEGLISETRAAEAEAEAEATFETETPASS